MPNTSTGEARHRQSMAATIEDAANYGWRMQVVEHDGLRQYRMTKAGRIASAYFEWNEDPCPRDTNGDGDCGNRLCPYCGGDGTGKWRFALAFDHDAPEVPLRLEGLRAVLRGER